MQHVDKPSYFQTIWDPIASVGWYLVGLAIIVYYVFPHIEEKYKNWKVTKYQQDGIALNKKTDKLPQLSANVESARQKMQEIYNEQCTLAQLKEKEEKEKKRQKVLKLLETKNVGQKLGGSNHDETPDTSTQSRSLKSDYNPLMGDSHRGYRPPKRSCCKKGGCG